MKRVIDRFKVDHMICRHLCENIGQYLVVIGLHRPVCVLAVAAHNQFITFECCKKR
jgi:hypothetical protein